MEKLKDLRDIRDEVIQMSFTYKNVQRIMFLLYESKVLLESTSILPNKEIALDQTKKVIDNELMNLINSEGNDNIEAAFNLLIDNFKLVLAYIA
ncbi:MAG: hypothetical protein PF517_19145 [Salinivirgaceae bacterium]|jgi:hypothetical protein|nr:hypothetical protein [Salinivirgaceae bacterium]